MSSTGMRTVSWLKLKRSKDDWKHSGEHFEELYKNHYFVYLKNKGTNCCATAAGREEWELYVRNNSADTKVQGEKERGGHPDSGVQIPLQAMMKTVPWRPSEAWNCNPWKAGAGVGSWQETAAWRVMLARSRFCWQDLQHPEEFCSWRTASWGRTHAGTFLEENTHGEVQEEPCLTGENPCWSRQRTWGERSSRVRNWLQLPFPIPLHCCQGGYREFGGKVEPRKKGGVGERCLYIWVFFPLSYSVFNC